jgi:5-methyltetrahydrofolate corrinoid/iron sulfur protein methyltransferase
MLIVGELINASRKAIAGAIQSKDNAAIQKVAQDQVAAGAHYVDVNAGTFVGEEAQYLKWLVETIQETIDTPCCIDSPDPKAIEAALKIHNGTAMINSISMEKERLDNLMPLVAGTDLKVVALCMSDEGMPETADQRVSVARSLVENLTRNNVPLENIYVDPLVQPISTNKDFGCQFLDAVERIQVEFPGVHTICGLSNISFGLPLRKLLNTILATMAITKGLDGLIINPLDSRLMASIITAETIAGRDDYCEAYLDAFRDNKLTS